MRLVTFVITLEIGLGHHLLLEPNEDPMELSVIWGHPQSVGEVRDCQVEVSDLTNAVRMAPDNRELHRILIGLKQEMAAKGGFGEKEKPLLSIINDSHDSSSGVSSNLEIAE